MTQLLHGFDIYHGDGEVQFGLAKKGGMAFVIAKATQGTTEVDPLFAYNRQHAKEAGLVFGAYHFFTDADPIKQADHFLAVAKPEKGELVLTLDVETYFDGVGASAMKAAQHIKQLTGRWPIIYTGQAFYLDHLAATFPANMFTLWVARYGSGPTVAPIAFWQYSQSGQVAGHQGQVDLDYFVGADLETHRM